MRRWFSSAGGARGGVAAIYAIGGFAFIATDERGFAPSSDIPALPLVFAVPKA
jgi:hypothetical protein